VFCPLAEAIAWARLFVLRAAASAPFWYPAGAHLGFAQLNSSQLSLRRRMRDSKWWGDAAARRFRVLESDALGTSTSCA